MTTLAIILDMERGIGRVPPLGAVDVDVDDDPGAELVAGEIFDAGDWPTRLPAYRRELRRYAAALRGNRATRKACQDELRTLCQEQFGGLLGSRDPFERAARRDALNEMVADTEGLAAALELAAERLSKGRPPNMVSFLRAKLIWRANDILESETRRHNRRVTATPDPLSLVDPEHRVVNSAPQTVRRILLAQIFKSCASSPCETRILTGLANGESIAEMARQTGQSRQQIYRFLERVRQWAEAEEEQGGPWLH